MSVLLDCWCKIWSIRGTYVCITYGEEQTTRAQKIHGFYNHREFLMESRNITSELARVCRVKKYRSCDRNVSFPHSKCSQKISAIVSTHYMWSSEVSHNMIQRLYHKMKVCVKSMRIEHGWWLQECEQPFLQPRVQYRGINRFICSAWWEVPAFTFLM